MLPHGTFSSRKLKVKHSFPAGDHQHIRQYEYLPRGELTFARQIPVNMRRTIPPSFARDFVSDLVSRFWRPIVFCMQKLCIITNMTT
jgi:hypothetical protein